MIKSELKNIFYKIDGADESFLRVVFETSEGLFELDNCKLERINAISKEYKLYDKNHYNPDNLPSLSIVKVLCHVEMEFIIVLSNDKTVIIYNNSVLNNGAFSQVIEVFDFKSLTEEYLADSGEYC